MFPLLTAMEAQRWPGLSVLYVCPLKALLNNLLPRLEQYAGWLGRRAAIWHGDVTAAARQRILRDPPDMLLTTPESLEAMLISVKVDPARLFARVRPSSSTRCTRSARDDRGWHLLAVLERLTRAGRAADPADRPVGHDRQPGRAAGLAAGFRPGHRPAMVVAPEAAADDRPVPRRPWRVHRTGRRPARSSSTTSAR